VGVDVYVSVGERIIPIPHTPPHRRLHTKISRPRSQKFRCCLEKTFDYANDVERSCPINTQEIKSDMELIDILSESS
jgi:hypothetical protein